MLGFGGHFLTKARRYSVTFTALRQARVTYRRHHDTGPDYANAGANPKELMARMGHDNERAAMIYLHSSRERQRALADAVGEAARGELAKSKAR